MVFSFRVYSVHSANTVEVCYRDSVVIVVHDTPNQDGVMAIPHVCVGDREGVDVFRGTAVPLENWRYQRSDLTHTSSVLYGRYLPFGSIETKLWRVTLGLKRSLDFEFL